MPLNKKGTGTIKGYKIGPKADLRAAVLPNTNLKGANLSKADLRDADLAHSDLSKADLSEADLRGANLEGAKLHQTLIDYANFTGANLHRADIYMAGAEDDDRDIVTRGAIFNGADLSRAKIKDTEFKFPDFSEVEAERIKIERSYFRGPDMHDADFSKSSWVGLRGGAGGISEGYLGDSRQSKDADLRGADFRESKFRDYSIKGADLEDADFSNSKFEGFDFNDNKYKNTKFDGSHFGPTKLKKLFGRMEQRPSTFGDYYTKGRPSSLKNASFKDATFEILPKGNGFIFRDLAVMPDSMYKILRPEIEKERAEIDELIKNHPNYMGQVTGLWMHMTSSPFLEMSRTEMSVSPYRPGETYYNQGGYSIYGLVFRGKAHLFDLDVNTKNGLGHFGYLVPSSHAGVKGRPDMIHKEAFLDLASAELVGVEIDKGILDEFVKRGPDYSYSVEEYKKFIKRVKAAKIPIKYVKNKAARGKVTDWVKGAKRKNNHGHECCVCSMPASLMSAVGDVFCQDCF